MHLTKGIEVIVVIGVVVRPLADVARSRIK